MQPSCPFLFAGLAFGLLATATLRSAEVDPARASPSAAPAKTPADDPFVKGDGPAQASTGGKRPVPQVPSAVFVQEVYALKKEDALAVLEDSASGGDRYQRVLALERDNKARLLILTALTNKSGQRANIQSVECVRYPTSFRPPTDAMPAGSAFPTSFEIRNAGDLWEMEPIITEGGGEGTINLQCTHVGMRGFTDCPAWPGDPVVEQPRFTRQSLATEAAFRPDEPAFLGTFTPANPDGFLEGEGVGEISLAFLRVHILPPEVAAREPGAGSAKVSIPQSLNVQYTLYSLDRRAAREVVNAGPGVEAPWAKLQSVLLEKRAKIEHVFAIATKSGEKCAGAETDEVLYGTQFSAPEYVHAAGPAAPVQVTGKNQAQASPEPTGGKVFGTTTTTEKRDTGLSFELEPVLSPDGAAVEINHELSGVTYLGNLDTKTLPAQPLFESRKFTCSLTVGTGKHVLVATFNPPSPDGVNGRNKDDGKATLMFVQVTPAQ